MIEGLKFRVTSTEVREHCLSRSDHHLRRADVKDAELPKLEAAAEAMQPEMKPTNLVHKNTSNYVSSLWDQIDRIKEDILSHHNKALAFRFFADHLFEEDYNLCEADLKRLEILK